MGSTCVGATGTGDCTGTVPVIRDGEGQGLVFPCDVPECGQKTVGVPQYDLSVDNEVDPEEAAGPSPEPAPDQPIYNAPSQVTSGDPATGSADLYAGLLANLSWTSADGASLYSVWLNGVLQGTTSNTFFSIPVLTPNTTYTWRVDSIGPGGLTTGQTWTFSTSAWLYPLDPAGKAENPTPVDGATGVNSVGLVLSWSLSVGATSYNVYLNGVFQGNQAGVTFSSAGITYASSYTWRVDSLNAAGAVTAGDTWSFTTQVAPPEKATTPDPADSATGVSTTQLLSWANGGGATSFDVYVNGAFQGNQAGTTFDPGTLNGFTDYTWRIDAVNAAGTVTGDTWSFTTTGHATVISWASRVVANGGAAPSQATKAALSTFCVGLDSAGLAAKIAACCCFVSDNLIASITPLIKNYGNDPWTNTGPFAAGDLTVDGLKGDGSTKYLKTGLIASAFMTTSSAHACVYISQGTATQANAWGVSNGANNCRVYDYTTGVNEAVWTNFSDASATRGVVVPGYTGFLIASRTGTGIGESNFYLASNAIPFALLGSSTGVVGGSPPTVYDLALFATNESGTWYNKNDKRFSYASAGTGMTAGECQTYFNLVQALRTTLGGGYS